MHETLGASTPAIEQLCNLKDNTAAAEKISVRTINRLFMLTLPAHLQLNYGKPLDPTHRDALRAQIIRTALSQ
jgi:protein-arginine kinase